RNYVMDPLILGRIFEYKRIEYRITNQLDILRRIMLVVLNAIQLEQTQRNLIAQDLEIGAIFGSKAGLVPLFEPRLKVDVETPLAGDALRTEIVQRFVEAGAFVPVIARLRRADRGERQDAEDEILSD